MAIEMKGIGGMNISKFLQKTHKAKTIRGHTFIEIRPKVQCVDGFTMSVQASEYNYCSPRNNDGQYTSVEIGYLSAPEDLIMQYAEDGENPTGTVYGWVPVDVVQSVVDKHGGIAPTLAMMAIELS